MDERFHSFAQFLKRRFPGERVLKIPLNGGFSCPNRDGTLSTKGCIFCDPYAAGPVRTASWSIERQIEAYTRRHPQRKFIAYFQSHCNTHAPVPELRRKYEVVFNYENIVGLFIATRPDAIPPPVLKLLEQLSRRTYLSVELGLQSIHSRSLRFLNRNHTYRHFTETFGRLKARRIDVIVHLIIGIPGETRGNMRRTIDAMNALRPAGIKFHLLHVLRGTELQRRHERSPYPLLNQEEYIDILIDLLERLDPGIVVHRLTAERERELFIAPAWALNKAAVLLALRGEMERRGVRQGDLFRPAGHRSRGRRGPGFPELTKAKAWCNSLS